MASYVSIPSNTIERFLQDKGFTRRLRNNEVVYEYLHKKDSNVKVLVYTSIKDGSGMARDCGKDAIRVCTIFEGNGKAFGIGKFPRIYRVTSVEGTLERLLNAMRNAYQRGTDWIKTQNGYHL